MNSATKLTIAQLNTVDASEFARIVGPIFEHSPWIAEAAVSQRPFADGKSMLTTLLSIVEKSDEEKQVRLIQAHPDLVGRAALAGTLTTESNREQASAGLDQLSAEHIAAFQNYNRAYREKFGFPFVICARLNKRDTILRGFEMRLQNNRAQEIKTALEEIGKIARLRLQDLLAESLD